MLIQIILGAFAGVLRLKANHLRLVHVALLQINHKGLPITLRLLARNSRYSCNTLVDTLVAVLAASALGKKCSRGALAAAAAALQAKLRWS
jgi:Tfp pilus assembly protein PilN